MRQLVSPIWILTKSLIFFLFIDRKNINHHSNCIRPDFALNNISGWMKIKTAKFYDSIFVSCDLWSRLTRSQRNASSARLPFTIKKNQTFRVCIAWREWNAIAKRFTFTRSLPLPRTYNDPQSTLSSDIWFFFLWILLFCVSIPTFYLSICFFFSCTVCAPYLWFPFVFVCVVYFCRVFSHFNLSVSVIHLVSNTNLYDDNAILDVRLCWFFFLFGSVEYVDANTKRAHRIRWKMRESASDLSGVAARIELNLNRVYVVCVQLHRDRSGMAENGEAEIPFKCSNGMCRKF